MQNYTLGLQRVILPRSDRLRWDICAIALKRSIVHHSWHHRAKTGKLYAKAEKLA
ncbi:MULTISPECIES: hypothetical protein [Nostoc]|uniref:Uncharacterized protein n=2 Tax=Nostoc TaxID=1177 RepID=A0ABR8IJX3_9NOSO|nr:MULTISPECIES: hypothetical protein [Nostoc]MBD2566273.1 hypothetical protein [Nostoc linckia FACHB-391]MBD2651875.1 hypothetical protein [Nostoc foliaceum FACHB-393]